MARLMRALGFGIVAVLVTGCATPRYETTYRYESPASVEAQACIKGCEAKLDACRTDCQAAWQACTEQLEPQVEAHYAQALKEYADDLRYYRRMLDHYQWDLWVDWDFAYRGLWYSPWPYHPWPSYAPLPMAPGDPPTKETVRNSLRKSQCQDDCGCQPRYDTCFQGCGGKVVTETRCVANCPGGK